MQFMSVGTTQGNAGCHIMATYGINTIIIEGKARLEVFSVLGHYSRKKMTDNTQEALWKLLFLYFKMYW